MKVAVAILTDCRLLCGWAYSNKRMLEDKDYIIVLGDSITQEGVRPDGYVTLTEQAIAKAYPDLDITVIGAGISSESPCGSSDHRASTGGAGNRPSSDPCR